MSFSSSLVRLRLPGLLPLTAADLVKLPVLRRLLARAVMRSPQWTAAEPAAFAYLHDYGKLPDGNCCCCDPIHIRVDATQAVPLALSSVDVTTAEVAALVDAFNAHFADRGFRLHYRDYLRWYLCGVASNDTFLPSLEDVIGCNLQPLLLRTAPSGLNALLTEVQMLFYQHPVNQVREVNGLAPLNGVWIYGSGSLPAKEDCAWDAIVSESAVYKGMAQYFGIPVYSASAALEFKQFDGKRMLLHIDSLLSARMQGQQAWFRELQRIEQQMLVPIWTALRGARLRSFVIDTGMDGEYAINSMQSYFFWRRNDGNVISG